MGSTSAYYLRWPFWAGISISILTIVFSFHGNLFSNRTAEEDISLQPSMSLHPKEYRAASLEGINSEWPVKVVSSMSFKSLISAAYSHPRKRKMTDLTQSPRTNSMQTLINTWTNGSYSPAHKHVDYSEAFVVLSGALAFFTFTEEGTPTCHILSEESGGNRAIIIEKNTFHAMTAAPPSMGYPGHAVIFETSGHSFDMSKPTKVLAGFAPKGSADGLNGDPYYFQEILKKCPSSGSTISSR